jgi:mRNA interferase YafQ
MILLQTQLFKKQVKKLHKNQINSMNGAIKEVIENPMLGELKKGDLEDVRVHKFMMVNQLTLLAYSYDEGQLTILLLSIGSHENFYRDLKKR